MHCCVVPLRVTSALICTVGPTLPVYRNKTTDVFVQCIKNDRRIRPLTEEESPPQEVYLPRRAEYAGGGVDEPTLLKVSEPLHYLNASIFFILVKFPYLF